MSFARLLKRKQESRRVNKKNVAQKKVAFTRCARL